MTQTRRELAQALYEWLRSANPHLPPSNMVGGQEGVSFDFGPMQRATVTLTVLVDMPATPPPISHESEEVAHGDVDA